MGKFKIANMNQNFNFTGRRSHRTYTDKEVSIAQIEQLLEAAAHAPTTGNMQLYSVVISTDKDVREALAPLHFNQPATKAPVFLTFCADHNRFEKWCRQRDAVPGFENLQSLMSAVFDATVFAQQFCTLAELHGLGTCYLGTTTYNADKIARALDLPDRVIPLLTVTVGWPADQGEDVGRLPLQAVVHHQKYHDYSAQDIDRLYAEKEAREDSHRFVSENGKATLAQVFTDVRYPKCNNEPFSEVFAQFLRDNRYL